VTVEAVRPSSPPVGAWMEGFGPELRAHVRRMLGSADDADDVLQRVWITAHRSPPEASEPGRVRSWLYRVATNAALDRLAADRRRRAALEGRPRVVAPDGPASPDRILDGLGPEGRRRVREHVARLPTKQRRAVWMRQVQELAYAEIAGRLGCSEASARANVYQGMKKLRAELFDVWKQEVTS